MGGMPPDGWFGTATDAMFAEPHGAPPGGVHSGAYYNAVSPHSIEPYVEFHGGPGTAVKREEANEVPKELKAVFIWNLKHDYSVQDLKQGLFEIDFEPSSIIDCGDAL